MSIFLKLSWFFRLEWRKYLVALSMLIGIGLLSMVPPWITGQIIDAVKEKTLTPEGLLEKISIIVGLALAVYIMRFIWRIFLFGASFHLGSLLRQRIYQQLSLQSPGFYQGQKTGDLMAKATNDIDSVEMTAGEGVLALFDGLLTGIMVLVIMSTLLSWKLTLLAILPFPVMAWCMYRFGRELHQSFREAQGCFSDLNDKVQESISGIRMIKALGREEKEDQLFLQKVEAASQANLRVAKTDSKYDPTIVLTVGSSFFLCIAGGAWLITLEEMTLGELTSFTMYLGYLIWPMFAFGWLFNIVERGSAAYERIQHLLNLTPEIEDKGILEAPKDASISFDIQSFYYPEQENFELKDLKIKVPAGETLGIVGHTGAGKTTLLQLLLRHYQGGNAKIHVGAVPIQDLSLESLRSMIAYVPQEPFLFTATIAENIALGKPDASKQEIEAVAHLAAVDEDILRFPEQYDTLVGERGVTLSGGQKQRIAIARALLLDAPILLLDDSLSAVDSKTERSILLHLKEQRRGRTTLIICHRLSAVEDANEIIVLKQGEIIERGDHAALLLQQGWYRRMVEYQQLERSVSNGK